MKKKAVIDRIEGNNAVIIVMPDNDRLVIPKSMLPGGSKEGDWLKVDVSDDRVLQAESDPEATKAARERIASKLNQLRKK
jgi:hypothetical protein